MSDFQDDLLDRVNVALDSPKVDAYMLHQYLLLAGTLSPDELLNMKVSFLAELKPDCPVLDGELGRIGNIASVMTTYSSIPEFVTNPKVIYLEASREMSTFESVAVVQPYKKMYYIGTAIIIATAMLLAVMILAKIQIGRWIIAPLAVGFIVQMYGLSKSRPK